MKKLYILTAIFCASPVLNAKNHSVPPRTAKPITRTQRLETIIKNYRAHVEQYICNSFEMVAQAGIAQKIIAPLATLLNRLAKTPTTDSIKILKYEGKLEHTERTIMERYHYYLALAIDKLRARHYPSTEIPEAPLLLPHDDDIPLPYSATMRQAMSDAFKEHFNPAIIALASNPTVLFETIKNNPELLAANKDALQRFIKLSFMCSNTALDEIQVALKQAISSEMLVERIKQVKETINNPSLEHYKQVIFQHLPYNATTEQKVQAFYALAFYKALEAAI